MQYNCKYRVYHHGRKKSQIFDDIVPPHTNIIVDGTMWGPRIYLKTPFTEVRLLPYTDPPDVVNFLRNLVPAPHRTNHIWREFKMGIYEMWKPEKIHVIGASSGYDTRLIAKALQEMKKEYGSDWFGETYFVECGGEGESFKAIMKALKFKNYIIWEPDYTFEYFKNHHKRYNGLCSFPVNQWYDYYIKNWNENDIQYVTGYGGNVTEAVRTDINFLRARKERISVQKRLTLFFRYQYYYQLSAFRHPKDSIYPFLSWRYITAISGIYKGKDRMSRELSRVMVSECENIRRMTILGDVKGLGYLTLKPGIINELYEWYLSTKYGSRNRILPSRKIEYNRWWLHFCIASYVEKDNDNVR